MTEAIPTAITAAVDTTATPATAATKTLNTISSSSVDVLLLHYSSLTFLYLATVGCAAFGALKGLIIDNNLPDNASYPADFQTIQLLLSMLERILLIVILGNFNWLRLSQLYNYYFIANNNHKDELDSTPISSQINDERSARRQLLYVFWNWFVILAVSILVSVVLEWHNIRSGSAPQRVIVAIIVVLILIPPLILDFTLFYDKSQRIRSLVLLGIYLVFLIAQAGLGGLHLHHWTYSFIFLIIFYPPHTKDVIYNRGSFNVSNAIVRDNNHCQRFYSVLYYWSHFAACFAMGICLEGLVVYGSAYHFHSSSESAAGEG
jgi:magnesium-transporting ATPase (P-type)